jgi:carboxyl-terminal processing protease
LRDIRNIKLVGEKTFGKGTVQEVRDLRDGSSIKISIAEWLTPNGTSINKSGIEPDFVVALTEEDIKNGVDPQLEKALDILEEETGLSF